MASSFEDVQVAGGRPDRGDRLAGVVALPGNWPSGFEPWPPGNPAARQCAGRGRGQWTDAGLNPASEWQRPAMGQRQIAGVRERCKYYMEGRCKKADSCPFSHDFRPQKKAELCKYYAQSSGCHKGDSCVFMHGEWPCKFFHLYKSCNMSSGRCKFSHDPITQEATAMLRRIQDETTQPKVTQPIADAIRYHRQQSASESSSSSNSKAEGNSGNKTNNNSKNNNNRDESYGSTIFGGQAPDLVAAQRQYSSRPYADLYAAQWRECSRREADGPHCSRPDSRNASSSSSSQLPTALVSHQRRRSRSPNREADDEADWKLRGRRQQRRSGGGNSSRSGRSSRTSGRH